MPEILASGFYLIHPVDDDFQIEAIYLSGRWVFARLFDSQR
ncbi:hypothetical protein N9L06_07770 [Mariniblastus sp.]|nr:hypothetical protein [Mariniblastus sp.]